MPKNKEKRWNQRMKNYYEILQVNPRASKEIIEKAYQVLAKRYHPDLHTGEKKQYAEKKMKEINEAYHVLSDEFLREQYDNEIYNQTRIQMQGEVKTKVGNGSENNYYNRNSNKTYSNQKQVEETFEERMKKHKTGSFGAMVEITKQLLYELVKNKEKRKQIKDITKKDIFAIILTIIVVILIGIILWFIPFTNGWMRELIFENPLFSWMFQS